MDLPTSTKSSLINSPVRKTTLGELNLCAVCRILEFAHKFQLTIQLAYYPPYHSKYNPIDRAFGWLEQHWNGSLLDSVETVLQFASTLTFKGKNPLVTLVDKVYHTGVKLTELAMAQVEQQFNAYQV